MVESHSFIKTTFDLIHRVILWRQRFVLKFGRLSIVFPILSLIWGIISAVFITRDYSHSSYLAASLGCLILVSIFLKLWLGGLGEKWMKRLENQLTASKVLQASTPLQTFLGYMARPKVLESFAVQATQYCIQYIAMFCIPLLYAAEAWGTLALTVVIAATTLWEDWWQRLVLQSWYGAIIRGTAAVLATSFSFAVLFPKAFIYFYPVMASATFVAVLPWAAFFPRRRPKSQEVAIVGIVVVAISLQFFTGEWMRVPLLSVWVRKPAFGLGVLQGVLREKLPRRLTRANMDTIVANDIAICCLTPVVSPSGLIAKVSHEWLVNGKTLEIIPLGRIRSTDKTELHPYKTYSCKQNFPPAQEIKSIECRVYLDETVDIGGARLVITK